MITDEAVKKKIRDAIVEISGSMTRIEAERDFIKEAINNLSEETEVDKKTLRRIAKHYHKQDIDDFIHEAEEVEAAFEEVFGEDDAS